MRLDEFYKELQLREGMEARSLAAPWDAKVRAHFEAELRQAISEVPFIGEPVANLAKTASGDERTNQSKGNVIADALCEALKIDGSDVRILKVSGQGYPDRRIVSDSFGVAACFEIKATSGWRDTDGIRRVLTATPKKLAKAIDEGVLSDPPCHLIGTVLYDKATGAPTSFRLDFLEPSSEVYVRLEASTSQALLARGSHYTAIM